MYKSALINAIFLITNMLVNVVYPSCTVEYAVYIEFPVRRIILYETKCIMILVIKTYHNYKYSIVFPLLILHMYVYTKWKSSLPRLVFLPSFPFLPPHFPLKFFTPLLPTILTHHLSAPYHKGFGATLDLNLHCVVRWGFLRFHCTSTAVPSFHHRPTAMPHTNTPRMYSWNLALTDATSKWTWDAC